MNAYTEIGKAHRTRAQKILVGGLVAALGVAFVYLWFRLRPTFYRMVLRSKRKKSWDPVFNSSFAKV